jgi:hypothetical protein
METAFLIFEMKGTTEELNSALIGKYIFAAIGNNEDDGSPGWTVSMIPIGRISEWTHSDGMLRVTLDLLKGEVDRI